MRKTVSSMAKVPKVTHAQAHHRWNLDGDDDHNEAPLTKLEVSREIHSNHIFEECDPSNAGSAAG